MKEKQPSKIAITDIADRCGVSRQTVYYHFSNLEELVDNAFERRLNLFLEKIKKCSRVKEAIVEMLLVTRYNIRLVSNCAIDKNKIKFDKIAHHMTVEVLKEIADERYLSGLSKSEYEKTIDFYSYAITGMAKDIGKGEEDIDEAAEQLLKIMRRGFNFKNNLLT